MPPAEKTRGRPVAVIGVVIAVIVLGCAATLLAWRSEANRAADRDQVAADVAAATLSKLLMQTISSLRNTDGLAVDGSVSEPEFAAAAADLLPGSLFRAIAYAEVVADNDRSEFESRTGLTIRDTTGTGDFVTAAPRDPHLVVVVVAPVGGAADALLGFDIASDETRRQAATASAASDEPQFSEPIRLADSAAAGIFAVQRVRDPDHHVVGYFSSGIPVDALVAAMGSDRTNEVLTLSLGSTVIAGTGSASGRTASFDAGGKSFTVRANDLRGTGHGLAWLTGIGTLLLVAVVSLTFRRDRRLTARLGKALSTSDAIGAVARDLSVTSTLAEVAAVMQAHASDVVDASTILVMMSVDDAALVPLAHMFPLRRDTTPRHRLDVLVQRTSRTALETGRTALNTSNESSLPGGGTPHAVETIVAVPLQRALEHHTGTVVFIMNRQPSPRVLQAMSTLSDICAQTVTRVTISQDQARAAIGAARLSELTQALASAASADDVIEVVRRLIPPVLGARHALVIMATDAHPGPALKLDQGLEEFASDMVDAYRSIELSDDVPSAHAFAADRMILMENRQRYLDDYPHLGDVLQHMGIVAGAHVPVRDPAGVPIAVLSIAWAQTVAFHGTIRAVLTTIADVVGQTLARAALYDQEHELIVELQAALLAPVPEVDGLEIAVRYEPAISVVGIGGDWYDAVLTDSGRFVAVIGDVTGHGAPAVAMMAQVQAVIAHLTRIDTPASEVLQHASTLLATAGSYATALMVEIDVVHHTLRYVNAGHPYPLVRRATGAVERLTEGRRPLLGVDSTVCSEGLTRFEPGDRLLLYTDGLIERREQSIDHHIDRLAVLFSIDTSSLTAADELDSVVTAARAPTPESGGPIDDDLAAMLIRHLPQTPD